MYYFLKRKKKWEKLKKECLKELDSSIIISKLLKKNMENY